LMDVMNMGGTIGALALTSMEARMDGERGPQITAARYVTEGERLVVHLTNGVMLAIPADLIEGMADMDTAARGAVEIVDDGYVLRWGAGLHLSALAIALDVLGGRAQIEHLSKPALHRLQRRRELGALKRPRR